MPIDWGSEPDGEELEAVEMTREDLDRMFEDAEPAEDSPFGDVLRERIAAVAQGRVGVDQFREWYGPASWDAHLSEPARITDLMWRVELVLAEHASGDLTDDEMWLQLEKAVARTYSRADLLRMFDEGAAVDGDEIPNVYEDCRIVSNVDSGIVIDPFGPTAGVKIEGNVVNDTAAIQAAMAEAGAVLPGNQNRSIYARRLRVSTPVMPRWEPSRQSRIVYSVVRWVADTARDEPVVIGLIVAHRAASERPWTVASVPGPRIDQVMRSRLQVLAHDYWETQAGTVGSLSAEDWLHDMHLTMRNAVRVSAPVPVAVPTVDEAVRVLSDVFLAGPSSGWRVWVRRAAMRAGVYPDPN